MCPRSLREGPSHSKQRPASHESRLKIVSPIICLIPAGSSSPLEAITAMACPGFSRKRGTTRTRPAKNWTRFDYGDLEIVKDGARASIGHPEEMLDRQPTQLQSVLEAMNKSARPNYSLDDDDQPDASRVISTLPAFNPLSTSWLIFRSRTKITCIRLSAIPCEFHCSSTHGPLTGGHTTFRLLLREARMVQLFAISSLLLAFSIVGLDYWFRACHAVGPIRAWQLLRHDRTP